MSRSEYTGPERREAPDEVWRRLKKLEDKTENGMFVRKDVFELVNRQVRDDYEHIVIELASLRAEMKADREAREADRKGIRNLIFAALLSAGGSIVVSLLVAAGNKP